MPLKNTGKTIQKITKKAKEIIITFENKEKQSFHLDTLEMFSLYEGKVIYLEEYKQMLAFSNKSKLMDYALSLLKKGHYSINRMKRKLNDKISDKTAINFVINKLKEFDLINDYALIEELCCYYDEQNIGQNKILYLLKSQELEEKDLNKIKFPITLEKEKAVNNLTSLEKKFSSLPFEMMKKKIYLNLLSKGFNKEVALSALEEIQIEDNQEEKDLEKLNKDLEAIYDRYTFKYHGRELKEKVFNKLISKGYQLRMIANTWREKYE